MVVKEEERGDEDGVQREESEEGIKQNPDSPVVTDPKHESSKSEDVQRLMFRLRAAERHLPTAAAPFSRQHLLDPLSNLQRQLGSVPPASSEATVSSKTSTSSPGEGSDPSPITSPTTVGASTTYPTPDPASFRVRPTPSKHAPPPKPIVTNPRLRRHDEQRSNIVLISLGALLVILVLAFFLDLLPFSF